MPEDAACPTPDDVERLDADPVRAFDPRARPAMVAEVDAAREDGDTLGGVVEVLAYGLPPGLGRTSTGTASSTPGSPRR